MLFSNNGIIKKAQDAKDAWKNAEKSTMEGLQNLADELANYIENMNGETGIDTPSTSIPNISTLNTIQTSKIEAQDRNGNKVIVPSGFKVLSNEGSTVQEGIVIQDADGNEFVWIPVGTIQNEDGTATTIELARYEFNTDGTIKNKSIEGTTSIISYQELDHTDTTSANVKAINIEEFKLSVLNNNGYYIARYEASYRSGTSSSDYIPYSKVSTSFSGSTLTKNKLWNYITQPIAAAACRNMYRANNTITSDLVNSYAWDTAIVYIQTYSGDLDYSRQKPVNTLLTNTGTTGDKMCNIYDMASNTIEWSTETCNSNDFPCTLRGGYFSDASTYSSFRRFSGTYHSGEVMCFRPILYIN